MGVAELFTVDLRPDHCCESLLGGAVDLGLRIFIRPAVEVGKLFVPGLDGLEASLDRLGVHGVGKHLVRVQGDGGFCLLVAVCAFLGLPLLSGPRPKLCINVFGGCREQICGGFTQVFYQAFPRLALPL